MTGIEICTREKTYEELEAENHELHEMCETLSDYVEQSNARVKHLEKLYQEAKSRQD